MKTTKANTQDKSSDPLVRKITALKEWANPEPPEISGPQWQERMPALIDILTELGPIMDLLKHWDINIGKEVSDMGKEFMRRASQLYKSNPMLCPLDSIEYSTGVTTLRCDISNFADRLQALLETVASEQTETESAKQKPLPKLIKDRFSFAPGQVCFDRKDLNLPTGLTIDVCKKLHDNFGSTVPYENLSDDSSPGNVGFQLRRAKIEIVNAFKKRKVPCQVKTKPREGYCLCEIIPSKNLHKRATRK